MTRIHTCELKLRIEVTVKRNYAPGENIGE